MFQKITIGALVAGFGAGLVAAALQFAFVNPLLLHAELFENGTLRHFGAAATAATADLPTGIDLRRDGLSVVFSALIYTGYGFILAAAMALAEERGARITPRSGMIWGLAGFIALQLAPAFGLAPELPGMSAADVTARQVWWFATAGATAAGLWLIAFGQNWAAWGTALILMIAPHLIGAPLPDTLAGPTPPELASAFAARALGTGMTAWAALGLFLGVLWNSSWAET